MFWKMRLLEGGGAQVVCQELIKRENNIEGSHIAFQEDAENRRNEESDVIKCNEGKRKSRPSEKEKEGLPVR